MHYFRRLEQWHSLPHILQWIAIACVVAALSGTASAFFLFALDWATATREGHRWLLWLLPVAGFAVGWIYLRIGQQVEAGNHLVIDEIHDPKKVLPLRLAPLVLGGTVISHLFGASVGREGTAVQMGAALSDQLTHLLRLPDAQRRILLLAGLGFVAVFAGAANTPLASTLMAMELFGSEIALYAGLACVVSYLFSGHSGIYRSQRVGGKYRALPEPLRVGELSAYQRQQRDVSAHERRSEGFAGSGAFFD